MDRLAPEIGRAQLPEQRQVPPPLRQERPQRGLEVDVLVAARPGRLVEGLDGVVVLRENLPRPEPDGQLGVREVGEDLLARPFAGAPAPREPRVPQPPRESFHALGRGLQALQRIALAEEAQDPRYVGTVCHRGHVPIQSRTAGPASMRIRNARVYSSGWRPGHISRSSSRSSTKRPTWPSSTSN